MNFTSNFLEAAFHKFYLSTLTIMFDRFSNKRLKGWQLCHVLPRAIWKAQHRKVGTGSGSKISTEENQFYYGKKNYGSKGYLLQTFRLQNWKKKTDSTSLTFTSTIKWIPTWIKWIIHLTDRGKSFQKNNSPNDEKFSKKRNERKCIFFAMKANYNNLWRYHYRNCLIAPQFPFVPHSFLLF